MRKKQETLSVLLLVKERVTTFALANLINEISGSVPYYNGLNAAYCVSANPTKTTVSFDVCFAFVLRLENLMPLVPCRHQ